MNTLDSQSGKCSNFGNCSLANSQAAIQVPVGTDYVCTECGKPLLMSTKAPAQSNKKALLIGSSMLALVVVGTWLLMHNRQTPSLSPAPAQVSTAAPNEVTPSAPAAAPISAANAASPAAPAALITPAAPTGSSLEVQSHIKQAFAYISMAKNAQGSLREEHIENAVREFSQAVQKAPTYAEAYSNRAIAYMQQKKFNKAEDDLRRAKELAPNSPSVRYNYACLHSLKGNVDLALDEIDAALAQGFSDYDALRLDPDLTNARKHPEFRKILEKHKVFILK